MNEVLTRWNGLSSEEAAGEILACCGSSNWALRMAAQRPIHDEIALLNACDETWESLAESDWQEAIHSHPRIGERKATSDAAARSTAWSEEEQRKVSTASEDVKNAIAEGNRAYERRFDRVFIVCATGKSAPEILEILQKRLRNDPVAEIHETAEQLRQITHLRLKKWLSS